jgi:hypothetical protein
MTSPAPCCDQREHSERAFTDGHDIAMSSKRNVPLLSQENLTVCWHLGGDFGIFEGQLEQVVDNLAWFSSVPLSDPALFSAVAWMMSSHGFRPQNPSGVVTIR